MKECLWPKPEPLIIVSEFPVPPRETAKTAKSSGVSSFPNSTQTQLDIGNDGIWDVCQLEGPAMIWYFRGDPYVHTWVHIRQKV